MHRIKCLSADEASKIAAGEVIDRPAHVVKELLENALDAQATEITVYLEKAGKHLIRVIDNGSGMVPEDAHVCFAHHATSKIKTVNDLNALTTFGFRGEALASIAAVSVVTLTTKTADALHGVTIERKGADTLSVREASCVTGTDLTVRDLFYNIPVRKKFLRADETEWHQIQQLFCALALAHKQVHFKLYTDNKLRYNCPATDSYATRVMQLWGHDIGASLHELSDHNKNGIVIEGVITGPHYLRYDRSQMYMLVNRRWIKNHALLRAWLQGYANVLPTGKCPAGVICLTIDPAVIDVNIHPRKEELQFLHPRTVEQQIAQAVRDALQTASRQHLEKSVSKGESVSHWQQPLSLAVAHQKATPFSHASSPRIQKDISVGSPYTPVADNVLAARASDVQEAAVHEPVIQHTIADSLSMAVTEAPVYRIIGQYQQTYILLEHEDGLFIVDQHAAHERILYEQFATRTDTIVSVPLLFPVTVALSAVDRERLAPYWSLLHAHGIEVRMFGPDQVQVVACPVTCKSVDWYELFMQMLHWVTELNKQSSDDIHDALVHRLRAQMACKAAVKAGDVLAPEQLQQLITDLYRCPERMTCPHGRPTGWLLTTYELHKKFKRVAQ